MLNSARLLCDFQQVNAIAQTISGCVEPGVIAQRVTDALIDAFDCAFARIWLTNPDQRSLSLVASSGLYTHINGSFAQVPMGAYKVGKIAQNRVPFLSNCLPEEAWVKDRDWAIENQIQGFAGYPLLAGDRVLGVLATFSHQTMALEFLEVLQVLCLTVTIALDAAVRFQQKALGGMTPLQNLPLSDQLARVLQPAQLMLVGTERALSPTIDHVLLRSTELLNQLECRYCRLTYGNHQVSLEALISVPQVDAFQEVRRLTHWLGGSLRAQPGSRNQVLELLLQVPYEVESEVSAAPQKVGDLPALSDREREILTHLAQGMRDREIAKTLHISESTVKFHLNNTLAKLQAKNRYQAIYEAAKRDWI